MNTQSAVSTPKTQRFTVVVEDRDGDEHTLDLEAGANLLHSIQKAKIDIASSCGGGGWCSTCVVNVREGTIGDAEGDALSAMDQEDLNTMLENGLNPENQVLSCQAFVKGPCRISLPMT